MASGVRDYTNPNEIHVEPGWIHEPTNTVPPYPPELESALSRVARQNVNKLNGTQFEIVMRRLKDEGDERFKLAVGDRKPGISATCQVVGYDE